MITLRDLHLFGGGKKTFAALTIQAGVGVAQRAIKQHVRMMMVQPTPLLRLILH